MTDLNISCFEILTLGFYKCMQIPNENEPGINGYET